MFIPLTIDDMETEKTSYFLTGPKLVILLTAVLPYFFIFFVIDYIPDYRVFIIYTLMYLLFYQYIARYAVFEEKRQRFRMESLEKHKQSGVDFFWELERVGNRKTDNGMLYVQSNGISLKRGYIVEVDSGSIVGVPEGNYREYRRTIQEFYRYLSKFNLDVRVYNIQKRPELSESLKRYAGMLRGLGDKEALVKLMQLQIDINFVFSVSQNQRYISYYVITNSSISNLRNFRNIIQDAVDHTFDTNASFANSHILNKSEVDAFLANYLMQDAIDSDGIHKMNGFKDFSAFCEIVSLIDDEGNDVPVDLLDEINDPIFESMYLDDLIVEDIKEKERKNEMRLRKLDTAEKELIKQRRADQITHQEYEAKLKETQEFYAPENYDYDFDEEDNEKAIKLAERNRLREEKNKKKAGLVVEDNEKWYEKEEQEEQEVKTLASEKTYVSNNYILDIDDEDDDFEDFED